MDWSLDSVSGWIRARIGIWDVAGRWIVTWVVTWPTGQVGAWIVTLAFLIGTWPTWCVGAWVGAGRRGWFSTGWSCSMSVMPKTLPCSSHLVIAFSRTSILIPCFVINVNTKLAVSQSLFLAQCSRRFLMIPLPNSYPWPLREYIRQFFECIYSIH